jgi:hypothetical protein
MEIQELVNVVKLLYVGIGAEVFAGCVWWGVRVAQDCNLRASKFPVVLIVT